MAKDRKLWVVVALALAALVAATPTTFGAATFGSDSGSGVSVVGTNGNVVYVNVSNPTTDLVVGTVSVQAVVAGLTMTMSAPVTVAAGSSIVVPVLFPLAPTRVIGCSKTTDGLDPY